MYEALSLPRPELVAIAHSVSIEKNISIDTVFGALEAAVEKVAKNKYGYDYDIVGAIDRHDGRIFIFKRILIVDDNYLKENELDFNDNTMIYLKDVKNKSDDLKVGDYIKEDLIPIDFGRSNFQSVRQIVLQKIKSAEKEKEYNEFADKIQTIINGVVKKVEYGTVFIDINGKAEAIMKRNETIPRENLHVGDRIRALIFEIKRDNNGPQIFLTRSHPLFLIELFKAEIPEVYEGVISIKSVARDPGSKAKVAVYTKETSIDPVGACVGMKGSRIQNIVNELSGEKIDIIEWSDNIAKFAIDALAPAKIAKVIIDEEEKKIDAIVEKDQLSLAIGRHGQNVRLASQLLGWGIDVMSEEQSDEKRQSDINDRTEKFMKALDIDDVIAHILVVEGFTTVEEIALVSANELLSIEGFDETLVAELQNRAKKYTEEEKAKFENSAKELGIDEKFASFNELSTEFKIILANKEIKTLDDLADLSSDELCELLDNKISKDYANNVILKAREHWFN